MKNHNREWKREEKLPSKNDEKLLIVKELNKDSCKQILGNSILATNPEIVTKTLNRTETHSLIERLWKGRKKICEMWNKENKEATIQKLTFKISDYIKNATNNEKLLKKTNQAQRKSRSIKSKRKFMKWKADSPCR